MKPTVQKVGRITVALGLVLFGTALLVDNLAGSHSYFNWIGRLWPVILIGFGVEYLVLSALAHRRAVAGGEAVSLRFDAAGVVLLLLIGLFSLGVYTARNFAGVAPFFGWQVGGPSVGRAETKTVRLGDAKELRITVGAGSVELHQNPNPDEVRVEASFTAYGFERSQKDLESVHLHLTEGNPIQVSADWPGTLNNITIRLVVYAPPGLMVKTNTGAGSISVTDYRGNLTLGSGTGRIAVLSGAGSLDANSGAGAISVNTWEGPVVAKAAVGSLDISGVTGAVQLDSGAGSITVRQFSGGKLVADTKTGRVDVRTDTPLQGDVLLRTGAGSINLEVPEQSSMRVTAQTKAGSLSAPSFMSLSGTPPSRSGSGTLGDGKHTVTLDVGTGSIHVNTR